MIIPFPTVSGKSFKIPWFQSPPTRISSRTRIIHSPESAEKFIQPWGSMGIMNPMNPTPKS
jgi:hypothetical protein